MFPSRRVAAFSLVEITISFGILVVALMMAMSMVALSSRQQRDSTETMLARAYLSQRAALLRSRLHEEVLDSKTREARFQETMNDIDPAPVAGIGRLVDPNVVFVKRNDVDLTGPLGVYTCTFYQIESDAERAPAVPPEAGGLGLSLIDIDAGSPYTPSEADIKLPADMRVLPIRLTLTWTPVTATTKDGSQDMTVELNVLLY